MGITTESDFEVSIASLVLGVYFYHIGNGENTSYKEICQRMIVVKIKRLLSKQSPRSCFYLLVYFHHF